jgi:hypothetical protein
MLLFELPADILLIIILYLPGRAVESIARTYNRRLVALCLSLPIVQHRVRERQNERRMLCLFPTRSDEEASQWRYTLNGFDRAFQKLGLNAFGPYSEPPYGFHPCLDYMDLCDEVRWMDAMLNGQNHRYEEDQETFSAQLVALETRAETLGLKIPRAFLTMMHDARSRGLLFPPCYPIMGELVGIGTADGGAGYFVRFCTDMLGTDFWHLYLDAQGGQCVFFSQGSWGSIDRELTKWNTLPLSMDPQERGLGIRVLYHDNFSSAGLHLASTSFEAWLVEMCMSAWIAREVDPDAPDGRQTWKDLPTALVEYIVGICTEEGREALERGVAPSLLS